MIDHSLKKPNACRMPPSAPLPSDRTCYGPGKHRNHKAITSC